MVLAKFLDFVKYISKNNISDCAKCVYIPALNYVALKWPQLVFCLFFTQEMSSYYNEFQSWKFKPKQSIQAISDMS